MRQRTGLNRAWPACDAVARRWRQSLVAARSRVPLAALLLVVLASGCAQVKGLQDQLCYNDGLYQFTTCLHNRARAGQAWKRHAAEFCGEPHLKDFGAGFRQGYVDVANGEDGCPPPLPPRDYWASGCDTVEGQCRTEAWFAGYPCGAEAAEQDAAGIFRPIHASARIRQQYAWQHAEPTLAENAAPEVVPAGPAEPIAPASPGTAPAAPGPATPQLTPPQPAPSSPRPAEEPPGGRIMAAAPGNGLGQSADTVLSESRLPIPTWTPAPVYRR